jgi:hypothetical protein
MENHCRISCASVFTALADLAFVSSQGLAMPAVAALSMPNRIQVRRRRCRNGPLHWHTSFVAAVCALFWVQPQCFVDQRLGYPKGVATMLPTPNPIMALAPLATDAAATTGATTGAPVARLPFM